MSARDKAATWRQITDDVVVMSSPWHVFRIDFARTVTLLRLRDGRVVIHSSAPFTAEDIAAIRGFGKPAWLVDATLLHDTFAKEGRAAFSRFALSRTGWFRESERDSDWTIGASPSDWKDEIDVLKLDGNRMSEHALFHRRSAPLVVADLFFSFPRQTRGWGHFFIRYVMRLPRLFGVSVFFRMTISNRQAFNGSMKALLQWNFDRLVVAHREPIDKDAKPTVEQALRDSKFLSWMADRNILSLPCGDEKRQNPAAWSIVEL
jgi:hypothetical protein